MYRLSFSLVQSSVPIDLVEFYYGGSLLHHMTAKHGGKVLRTRRKNDAMGENGRTPDLRGKNISLNNNSCLSALQISQAFFLQRGCIR